MMNLMLGRSGHRAVKDVHKMTDDEVGELLQAAVMAFYRLYYQRQIEGWMIGIILKTDVTVNGFYLGVSVPLLIQYPNKQRPVGDHRRVLQPGCAGRCPVRVRRSRST